jgi:hypothetical protein
MKRFVLIIVILAAVLALAAGGVAAKGRLSNDIIVRDTAEDVLRAAADFVEETGSEPWDVEVYHDIAGSQWVVELIWP